MTSPYSPYADAESAPPDWRPGEEDAAAAFLALTFYLILDVNIGIHRVFKRKQGLYFWSLVIATWGCAADTIGCLLKNFKPSWGAKIWPFWTVLILCGWSLFSTSECLILYSRLHLVNRSPKVQRRVLITIIVGAFALVIANWVTMFLAYDVNPKVSSIWSPRMAIVDRTSQLGFSLLENIISGVYIWSLINILRLKPNVRQRRVMIDLIYVNVIVISVDLVVIILVFLNQVNSAYPIQVFSYALKFKLEFVVLNQLMAVAARGLKKESFAERRYHTPLEGLSTTQATEGLDETPSARLIRQQPKFPKQIKSNKFPSNSCTIPFSLKTEKDTKRCIRANGLRYEDLTVKEGSPNSASETDLKGVSAAESAQSKRSDASSYDIHLKPTAEYRSNSRNQPVKTNVTATRRQPKRGKKQREEDDEDEEEIGLYMWENRGKLILDVPWLTDRTGV